MSSRSRGDGIVNETINRLPFEVHLPGGYQFCGPGTKLEERLAKGEKGVNPLDAACREHDIAYSTNKDIAKRHEADRILQERAWRRVKASDASFGEKTAAWIVTNAMKAKRKLGMGLKKKSKKRNSLKTVTRKMKSVKKTKKPRVLPIPKTGGFLPLLPAIFAGLSALGGLAGGTAGIIKAVNEAKEAQQQLEESQRHNKAMEAKGSGLYLTPPKKGSGLRRRKKSKN